MVEAIVISLILGVGIFVVSRFVLRSISTPPECSSCAACRSASSCDHVQSPDAAESGHASQPSASQK